MPDSLTVCLGEHTYRVERPWGKLPTTMSLSYVSAVAVDSHGHVYLSQRSDPPIVVFDRDGAFVGAWGSGAIVDPHGMYIGPDDHVWVVDRDAHQIVKFDARGEICLTLGQRHSARFQKPFNHPAGVAVDADGDVYVADGYGNSMVHRFSRAGEWKTSWGVPGDGPGEFSTPHAVRVGRNGHVLICDRENNRLQFFSTAGEYIGEWSDLYHPMDVHIDSAGNVYVSDQIPRLSMFSAGGQLVGRCRPALYGAHGIWIDTTGDIYLAEVSPMDRLTKLVRVRDGI